jgi:hypothetical protein
MSTNNNKRYNTRRISNNPVISHDDNNLDKPNKRHRTQSTLRNNADNASPNTQINESYNCDNNNSNNNNNNSNDNTSISNDNNNNNDKPDTNVIELKDRNNIESKSNSINNNNSNNNASDDDEDNISSCIDDDSDNDVINISDSELVEELNPDSEHDLQLWRLKYHNLLAAAKLPKLPSINVCHNNYCFSSKDIDAALNTEEEKSRKPHIYRILPCDGILELGCLLGGGSRVQLGCPLLLSYCRYLRIPVNVLCWLLANNNDNSSLGFWKYMLNQSERLQIKYSKVGHNINTIEFTDSAMRLLVGTEYNDYRSTPVDTLIDIGKELGVDQLITKHKLSILFSYAIVLDIHPAATIFFFANNTRSNSNICDAFFNQLTQSDRALIRKATLNTNLNNNNINTSDLNSLD